MDEIKINSIIVEKLLQWEQVSSYLYKTEEGYFCGVFNPFQNAGDLKKVLVLLKNHKMLVNIQLNIFNLWSCEINNGGKVEVYTDEKLENAILNCVYNVIK
ncbi:hypothetical protein [Heyndrickxia camelliae]|uniref:Uncharacterized protein n=1 Tax=Heyndrickxia camelliae TaxID=1707093 RepID=A0A2N3LG57_9BACI|nr:hypothetical protein [Heyndrickxia camelliae]PKR83503.1 hypothetical protein CWO92_18210 [Heyndrickxia camelliae]